MSYALYAQYVVKLEPCPLCSFQRSALIAAWRRVRARRIAAHRAGSVRACSACSVRWSRPPVSASLSWHVRVQNLPPEEVPACGPGLDYMMGAFPFRDMISMVFTGSGECHDINWSFAGL